MDDIEAEIEMETRELTYSGKVDPQPGSPMGPAINGRMWRVVGSMYDAVNNFTTVTLESPKK